MKINISSNKTAPLKSITENIDTRYADSLVTVLISKKEGSMTFIAGKPPLCSYCTFILDTSSTHLKDAQFSIDGSFVKQLPYYFNVDEDIELNVHTLSSSVTSIELIHKDMKSNENALRRCECVDVYEEHLTYLKESSQRLTYPVPKASLERVIYESSERMPFEFLEMNVDKQHCRIQRDGDVEEVHLPDNLELPASIVLTEEINRKLNYLCKNTESDVIEFVQQGELLTFKTPETTLTYSLAGVEEFFSKKPLKFTHEKHVVVNFYELKGEVSHCSAEYKTIKKADNAFLYLSGNEAVIAFITPPYEFVHPITVTETCSETKNSESLYRFSLKALLGINISDLTQAASTRLDILKYENGERKLGVYFSLENTLPHRTISIEKDESQLPKVVALLEELNQSQADTNTLNKKQEVQKDLFGYIMGKEEEY
ncbi:hypothetical protein I6F53_11100 [Pseudoalteromonas sp. SWN29]|uniref:hypothetical protein n=1 Tax=Pseudoalteromonas sp. SWN29 TaxID=2792064 RepID=UPI0018CFAEF0|nr:hypothetical protein [Pseudoalteromonas sp. SWN29]MBH0027531.1 hypothetical protein [Pseudoalteromonas sp. SWN29]